MQGKSLPVFKTNGQGNAWKDGAGSFWGGKVGDNNSKIVTGEKTRKACWRGEVVGGKTTTIGPVG